MTTPRETTELEPGITIASVSWRSAHWLEEVFDNLVAKADRRDSLSFLVVDNTAGEDRELRALCDRRPEIDLQLAAPNGPTGSCGHARGLDILVGAVRTEFMLITDPDCYVFVNGWDTVLTRAIDRDQAIAIGVPYPAWKLGKYHDFPSPIFALYRTAALRALGQDWYPFAATRLESLYHYVGKLVVRGWRIGTRARLERWAALRTVTRGLECLLGTVAPDTGWRIARAARESGARSIVLHDAKPHATCLDAHWDDARAVDLVCEWELYEYDGRPFVSHLYSTGSYFWSTPKGGDVERWRECVVAAEEWFRDD